MAATGILDKGGGIRIDIERIVSPPELAGDDGQIRRIDAIIVVRIRHITLRERAGLRVLPHTALHLRHIEEIDLPVAIDIGILHSLRQPQADAEQEQTKAEEGGPPAGTTETLWHIIFLL